LAAFISCADIRDEADGGHAHVGVALHPWDPKDNLNNNKNRFNSNFMTVALNIKLFFVYIMLRKNVVI